MNAYIADKIFRYYNLMNVLPIYPLKDDKRKDVLNNPYCFFVFGMFHYGFGKYEVFIFNNGIIFVLITI